MRRVRRRGPDRLLGLVTLAVAYLAQGCERDALTARRERVALDIEATRRAAPSAEAPVVARIQGGVVASVSAPALERELELRAGQTRDEALERLMRRELLWLELDPSALQLDEARLAELDAAGKRGRVDAMIERELAAPERQRAIAPEELSLYARRIASSLTAPEGFRASQIQVTLSPDLSPEARRQARADLERLIEPLRELDRVTLGDLQKRLIERDVGERRGDSVVGERGDFVLVGNMKFAADPSFEGSLPEGWGRVPEPFASAARDLFEARGAEQLAPSLIETPHGWHALIVHERFEPQAPDEQVVRAKASAAILNDRITQRLLERLTTLYRERSWSSDPSALQDETSSQAAEPASKIP